MLFPSLNHNKSVTIARGCHRLVAEAMVVLEMVPHAGVLASHGSNPRYSKPKKRHVDIQTIETAVSEPNLMFKNSK